MVELDRGLYSASLTRVETALKGGSPQEKGRSLEELVDCLFGCTKVFKVDPNVNTATGEIDRYLSVKCIPGTFLQKWSTYVPIECKNWSVPIGAAVVGWVLTKAKYWDSNIAIILSSSGITGNPGFDGLGTIRNHFISDKIATLVISLEDLHRINDGANLLVVLEEKYKNVRHLT